jgi:hypothetical protein
MTPKQELIHAIERSPDEMVYTLLEILKVLQRQSVLTVDEPNPAESLKHEQASPRLHRKQGILVIETGAFARFDVNAFIGEMREERIQDQIRQVNS